MPGMGELIVILLIVLVVFGANKLPGIGDALGRSIKNFKKASNVDEDDDDDKKDDKAGQEGAGGRQVGEAAGRRATGAARTASGKRSWCAAARSRRPGDRAGGLRASTGSPSASGAAGRRIAAV